MNVVMVGTGNVASVLARLIIQNGHQIVQVVNRNTVHAQELALQCNSTFSGLDGTLDGSADIFIIATTDSSLTDSFVHFNTDDKLVVHTAGSVPINVLQNISTNYGVLYPLQSLRKELAQLPTIPFLIDASSEPAYNFLDEFARTISNTVSHADDQQRLKLHTAAVIVSNFTNYLYAVAEEFCEKESIAFDLLKPLITETANRIINASPKAVQTGPAIRKDIYTLEKHLRILSSHPKLRTTYMRLTDSIMNP